MAYQSDIPQPNDIISVSQGEFLQNFMGLNSAWESNHVAFNASGEGKHKFLQMPEQSSAPTTSSNEAALYTKETSSISTLYFRKENNGTEIQMTNTIDPANPINPVPNDSDGITFLPGGLIVQFGRRSAASNNGVITFGTAFPTDCYSVTVTQNTNSTLQAVGINGMSTTGFTFRTVGGATPITFIAIGK